MGQQPVEVRTLADLPRAWRVRWGSAIAVGEARERCTFEELDGRAECWARALRHSGIEPGARVALWGGNSVSWLTRAFGVWKAGCTLIPLSTFATARELGEILASAQADILLADRYLRNRDLAQLLSELAFPHRLKRVVVNAAGDLRGVEDESEFLRSYGKVSSAESTLARPEDVAMILYTSGTTGKPKGVRLQHRAVLSTVRATAARGGLRPGDSVVSSLPLFWVAGLCIRALPTLASGSALVVMPTFEVNELLEILQHWRPTGLHLRPPQVSALLSHPGFRPELVRTVVRGGGRTEWFGPYLARARLITGYGMTEMSGYVTAVSWRDPASVRSTSIGRLLPRTQVRIVSEDGRECRPGSVGEIRVRGPGMFESYEGQPRGVGIDPQGFFCTGDLGYRDDNGQLHFVGRSKDLLRCKGINVSPVEVESVLAQHPTVEAAYVVGLPPDGFDQQLVALVVSRDGRDHEALWREWCEKALSSYKRPTAFILLRRDEVPFGPTSKPLRDRLAALASARLRREGPSG
ncbi:MAG: acyl--CoA ligase [Candidatus Binatia bacterium]|nr:acyl--CoA ligase [Candidatus Binatia bacterium]